ncbi:MAG: tRNA (N(6)-L-threonylcarbamoyladenosine(37)-C(2))-methylthiotransferase [Methanomassiliicoccales archaeon]|nr:MAG: tRNA (N(6)-L-threonylcarbamoyladenosine(37)-C(2))-methylthiotransferase [Methanomassiliicoccales archaeon]
MRFYEETFGCTMNQGESRQLVRALIELGHMRVFTPEESDLVLINTCVVIRPTELKIMKRLREVNQLGKKMIIAGCLPAVSRASLRKEFPEAMIIDPGHYGNFKNEVMERFGKGDTSYNKLIPQISGILPISQGCLGNCTYCLTKAARGDLSSRPIEILVATASELLKEGSKEILVTAQDTGCYGFDKDADLPELLGRLSSIDGEFFIRVGMMNPDSLEPILERMIEAYASQKVYKFLHLPVQSGSPSVLKKMGRGYSPSDFMRQVERFRDRFPTMTIATDIITGFPGETDEDHEMSMDIIKRTRPNIVNVTRYSARPGTPAARAKEQVPQRISKDRSRDMTELRFEIAKEHYSQFIGRTMRVLVTEVGKKDTVIARSIEYIPVVVPKKDIGIGQTIEVEITSAASTHLSGRLLRPSLQGVR